MEREEKLQQAPEKWSNNYYNASDYLNTRIAFTIGADWTDNNPPQYVVKLNVVWHDVEEFPSKVGAILYHTIFGSYNTINLGESGEDVWKEFVKGYRVKKWAYISDLLPKGGGE